MSAPDSRAHRRSLEYASRYGRLTAIIEDYLAGVISREYLAARFTDITRIPVNELPDSELGKAGLG